MFLHTFYTWLLANLIHPAIIILYFIVGEPADTSATQYFAGYLYFLWISLVVSLPCLFIGWWCFSIIARSSNPVNVKFTLWIVIAPSLAFCECMSLLALAPSIGNEMHLLIISATMAVIFSILTRYVPFKNYFASPVKLEI